MGYRGHIITQQGCKWEYAVANYKPDKLQEVFYKIENKLSEKEKEKYFEGKEIVTWLDEYGHDFEFNAKTLYNLFEKKYFKNFLVFLDEEETSWLKTMYNAIKEEKQFHLDLGYIGVHFY